MINHSRTSGFAIFTVILLLAIISLISVAMTNLYLTNTRATSLDLQQLKAQHLLDAGVRFAALSLTSPRSHIAASAVPEERIVYRSPDVDVVIEIQNEAGFIDLWRADKELLKPALLASGALAQNIDTIIGAIRSLKEQDAAPNYRRLRRLLRGSSIDVTTLLSITTLHNQQQGIHPSAASANVLSLVPKLFKAQRERLLADRKDTSPSLSSNPVSSDFFTSTLSAYYRISASVELHGQRYTRVQVIKIINQRGQLYKVQAIL